MRHYARVELLYGEKRFVGVVQALSMEEIVREAKQLCEQASMEDETAPGQLKESSTDYAEGHEAGYALGYRAAVHDTLEGKKGDKHT